MSELRADTITASDGTSPVTLTKQSAAKAWTRFNPATNTELDSLNQSSRSDDGAGLCTVNFTNSFNNANHAGVSDCSQGGTPSAGDGANISAVFGQTTTLTKLAYGYSGNAGGTTWALYDYASQKAVIHGDLA